MKYLVIIQQFIIIFNNYSVFVFAFQVLQFCDQNIASRSLRPERSRQRFKSILHAIVKQNLSILKELPILVSQVKSSNKIFLVKWAIPGLFYLNTVDSKRSIFFFANDWIRTADHCCQNLLLYQLNDNSCPIKYFLYCP